MIVVVWSHEADLWLWVSDNPVLNAQQTYLCSGPGTRDVRTQHSLQCTCGIRTNHE